MAGRVADQSADRGATEGREMIEPWQEDDSRGSFADAIAEIGRRVKSGEAPMPAGGYFTNEATADPYTTFLSQKSPADQPSGIKTIPPLNPKLKPFQRAPTEWALRRGRAALFEDTGLGKTLQQLEWARIVSEHEQAPILGLTPLAVAEQTVAEAAKFGIDGVTYAWSQGSMQSNITITNYDRLHLFDPSIFAGVFLDESSIIKSHDSKTRATMIETFRDTPWKLCCSATPAPNDYTELGNHAEFLNVMTEKEMLSMFFVHDGSVRAHAGASEWRLKRHAEQDFWRWLSSWAAVIRSPADLGFDEPGYVLPRLIHHQLNVEVEYKPQGGMLFPMEARTMSERLSVRRDSIDARVTRAADIVNKEPDKSWVVWAQLNKEADALVNAIPGSVQVAGSDDPFEKKRRLLGFCRRDPRVLVTKPKIGGWGMNWQHCSRMVFVGLNDSFEQLYQAKRRCWRYGQTEPVHVYMIASELEGAVVANLERKEREFEDMQANMAIHMRDLVRAEVLGERRVTGAYAPSVKMEKPGWL